VTRLVWYESYSQITEAVAREKELKKWRGDWKIRLIAEINPEWEDLYLALNQQNTVIPGSPAAPRNDSLGGSEAVCPAPKVYPSRKIRNLGCSGCVLAPHASSQHLRFSRAF
jgi:hypothetical protein